MNLGVTLYLLLSLAALPANSKTSAHKYSNTAATYTGAPAPTLAAYLPYLMYLATLPTGKVIPALADLECYSLPTPRSLPPLPFPFPAIFLYDI